MFLTKKSNNYLQDIESMIRLNHDKEIKLLKGISKQISSLRKDLRNLRFELIGSSEQSHTSNQNRAEKLKAYQAELDSLAGGIVETLPSPPSGLNLD